MVGIVLVGYGRACLQTMCIPVDALPAALEQGWYLIAREDDIRDRRPVTRREASDYGEQ